MNTFGGRTPLGAERVYPVNSYDQERRSVRRGADGAWYVFDRDAVERVLHSPSFGRGTGGPTPPEGEALHRIVRDGLMCADFPERVGPHGPLSPGPWTQGAVLRDRITVMAHDLVAGLSDRTGVELLYDFAASFPTLVVWELIGVPAIRREWFHRRALWVREAGSAQARREARTCALANRATNELAAYFREQIRLRRDDPHHDLISLLGAAVGRGEQLTDDQIVGACVHVLTAGHRTATGLLIRSALAMLARPDLMHQARSHPGLLPAVIDELMSHDPPMRIITRSACRHEKLCGHLIRPGETVVLVLRSADRVPGHPVRDDPPRPERWSGHCLDMSLARLEARIGLAALLPTFPIPSRADEPVPHGDDGTTRILLRTRPEERTGCPDLGNRAMRISGTSEAHGR